jgi:hypothetical protein
MNTKNTLISKLIPDCVSNNSDSNSANLEEHLTAFVQKSLADSYSQDVDTTLQLLDEAWEAQKLVWELRNNS